MNTYIVRNSDNSLGLVRSNRKPENVVGIAPIDPLTNKLENPKWLQVEDVEVEPGVFEKKITVNSLLKSQIQADQAQKRAERQSKINAKKKKRKLVRKKLRTFKKDEVVDLLSIQEKLDDIVEYLKQHIGVEEE